MDYIEGQTLDDCLEEWGALTPAQTATLLRPIAAALDYAHKQGVIHRDIKPGNVMVRKDGVPFILDFGIAREMQETMTRVTGKLSSGTLLYMSPEQLMGSQPKSAQDVYSFAAMAYECIKGEPPFLHGQIEFQILNKAPEPLVGGPSSCVQAIMLGLAKTPEGRPATCAGVLAVGDAVPRPAVVARRTATRVVVQRLIAAVVGVLLVAVGIWFLVGDRAPKEAPKQPPSNEDVSAVSGIWSEAGSQKDALGSIPDDDGFQEKKQTLFNGFESAKSLYVNKQWSSAAVALTNFVAECKALAELDKKRKVAATNSEEAISAKIRAENNGAKQHALELWNEAEELQDNAAEKFGRMEFDEAANGFKLAKRQFERSAEEAEAESLRKAREKLAEEERIVDAESPRLVGGDKLQECGFTEQLVVSNAIDDVNETNVMPTTFSGVFPTVTDFFATDPNYVCCTDVVFAPVYFGFNSSVVPQGELEKIKVVAQHLNSHPERVVMLEGNCDERGSNECSLSLGEGRSCAVRECLIKDGVDPKKIQTRSYGMEKPAVIGHGETAWARNRRCEFFVFEHKVVDLQDDSGVLQANDSGFNSISVSSRVHSMDNNSTEGDFVFLSPTDVMFLILRSTSQGDAGLASKLVCTKSFKILSEEQIRSEYLGYGDGQKQQNMRAFLKEALKVTIIQQKVLNDNNAEVLTIVPKSEVKRIFRSFGQSISEPVMDIREIYQCKKVNGRWRVAVLPD